LFSLVRKPIYTAMATTQTGFLLLVPTWVTLAALICLVVALQLEVRLIEEPY